MDDYEARHRPIKDRLNTLYAELKEMAKIEMIEGRKHDAPEYEEFRERAELYHAAARLIDHTIGRLEQIEQERKPSDHDHVEASRQQ